MQEEYGIKCFHDQLVELADADLLVHIIWSEAKRERVEGKLAVAHVVLNGVKARSCIGCTIQDVVLTHGLFTTRCVVVPDGVALPAIVQARHYPFLYFHEHFHPVRTFNSGEAPFLW